MLPARLVRRRCNPEDAGDGEVRLTAAKAESTQGRWILLAVIIGSGIVFLDGSVVTLALPKMGRELPTSVVGVLEGQAYITSGYLAVLAALLILGGALADHYGRRRVFTIGLAFFGIISALCGLAPTMEAEVVFRLAQGAAGALLVPGSLAIISANFQGPARGRAFGVWASATSALAVMGPLIGGILVDTVSWRAAFLINVPLVLVGIYATQRHVPESKNPDGGPLDWLGSIVIALAVGGISFGLIRGKETNWSDPAVFIALGVGVVAAILFPILMVKRPNPLIPPWLFRIRNFTVINISTFLIYGALYVTQWFNSLFLQNVLGYTALAASLVGLPSALLLIFGSTRAGTLAGRIGARRFLILGPLIMAAGQLWWLRVAATSTPWKIDPSNTGALLPPIDVFVDVLPATILFGIGITLIVAPLTTALMNSVPVANSGLGSAINNSVSRIGQPLILALLFIAISSVFYSSVGSAVPGLDTSSPQVKEQLQPLNPVPPSVPANVATAAQDASTDSFHLAMLVCALLLVSGAAVNGFGLRRGEQSSSEEEPSQGRTAAEPVPPEGAASLG
jgi:EmrB/QacA subfamily drug resistance transporter